MGKFGFWIWIYQVTQMATSVPRTKQALQQIKAAQAAAQAPLVLCEAADPMVFVLVTILLFLRQMFNVQTESGERLIQLRF